MCVCGGGGGGGGNGYQYSFSSHNIDGIMIKNTRMSVKFIIMCCYFLLHQVDLPITAGWTEAAWRSLPNASTHDQQWESNPKTFDLLSNALTTQPHALILTCIYMWEIIKFTRGNWQIMGTILMENHGQYFDGKPPKHIDLMHLSLPLGIRNILPMTYCTIKNSYMSSFSGKP